MNIKNLVLIVTGFVFLALGVAGIVLPVVPTTPFVLLAAACFSASSKKLNEWLQRSRIFGPYIENYRTGQGISKLRKIVSISFLWLGLIVSMVVVRTTLIYVILGIVGVGVTIHLLTIKTKRQWRLSAERKYYERNRYPKRVGFNHHDRDFPSGRDKG